MSKHEAFKKRFPNSIGSFDPLSTFFGILNTNHLLNRTSPVHVLPKTMLIIISSYIMNCGQFGKL